MAYSILNPLTSILTVTLRGHAICDAGHCCNRECHEKLTNRELCHASTSRHLLDFVASDLHTDNGLDMGPGFVRRRGQPDAARLYTKTMTKPVVAFIAGGAAPKDKKMGHAGAIVMGNKGTYACPSRKLLAVEIVDFSQR